MAEKVEVSQEDIAFVRSLEDCPDKPLHESMFVPFFASKIGEYRAAAFEAGRQQGLREAAEVADKTHAPFTAAAITALIEGEGK